MRLLTFTMTVFLLFTTIVYSQNDDALKKYIQDLPTEELSEAETDGIDLMREEEKLARDVYDALYDKWNINIFTNISRSEQSHFDLVGVIINKYGLADPITEEPGVFTDTHLQELYDALVGSGSESIVNAMFVGCTIEDLDIYDLEELMKITDNKDIRTVYQNLMFGSRNHMRAFEKQYSNQGETYIAQFITADELGDILESNMEQGPVDEDGNRLVISSVGDGVSFNPAAVQSFPNPFTTTTTIRYKLDVLQLVKINIYDSNGNGIATLAEELQTAGEQQVIFNSENLPQGMYYFTIQIDQQIERGRLLLVR